jgi:hypothetical protein
MGRALELITARATAPSTGAAFSAVTGDSLTIKAGKGVQLVHSWQTRQAAGYTRIISPMLHDGVVGIQQCGPIGQTLFAAVPEPLIGQDLLTVYGSGSATAGDMEFANLLVSYADLPGVDVKLLTPSQLRARMVDRLAVPNTIATPTTGEYAEELVGSEADQFKADTEYAILGATVQVGGAAIRWRGPDTGGLGIGMPAKVGLERGADYFVWLSEVTGLPLIPVIRSANKASTYIGSITDEVGADTVLCANYARLR